MRVDNESRFWSHVEKGPSCWEWQGGLYGGGYGLFSVGPKKARKTIPAHRFSYTLVHGAIDTGLFVCHTCDNKKCVNPKHLFVGTQRDNMGDCSRKNRAGRPAVKICPVCGTERTLYLSDRKDRTVSRRYRCRPCNARDSLARHYAKKAG